MAPTPDESTPDVVATKRPKWSEVSFAMVIVGAIITALLLVVLSMYLYNRSGAAQLDLSLPGLQEERLEAQRVKDYDKFRASGELDEEALDYFEEIYMKQQDAILEDHNGFDPSRLSDKALEIQVD